MNCPPEYALWVMYMKWIYLKRVKNTLTHTHKHMYSFTYTYICKCIYSTCTAHKYAIKRIIIYIYTFCEWYLPKGNQHYSTKTMQQKNIFRGNAVFHSNRIHSKMITFELEKKTSSCNNATIYMEIISIWKQKIVTVSRQMYVEECFVLFKSNDSIQCTKARMTEPPQFVFLASSDWFLFVFMCFLQLSYLFLNELYNIFVCLLVHLVHAQRGWDMTFFSGKQNDDAEITAQIANTQTTIW